MSPSAMHDAKCKMQNGRRRARCGPVLPLIVVCLVHFAFCIATAEAQPRPDLNGYWGPGRAGKPDPALIAKLPPNTVVLADAGAAEFPAGEFGGLKVKGAALEAARRWKPTDDMTISRACLPPSIIYTMQGPFPMEIFQGTEFIVMKLEYFDLVRIVFLNQREHPANLAHTKVGHSIGRWEGATLVVDTTHLAESTITNNGLNHSDKAHVIERFWVSADGKTLNMLQEFEDPEVLDNRGARFMAWDKMPGEHVLPYECDPSFGANYAQ
jgi:hypothetical protein